VARARFPQVMTTDSTALPELDSAAIVQSYRIALGRAPEPSALAHWTRFLNDGHSLLEMVAEIVASPEFAAVNGSSRNSRLATIVSLFRRSSGRQLTRAEKADVISNWLMLRSAEKVVFRLCRSKLDNSGSLLFPLLYPTGANPTDDAAYRYWVADFERLLEAQSEQSFEYLPTFSLIVSSGSTDPDTLTKSIDSALAQRYPNWELIICADPGRAGSGHGSPQALSRHDSRVRFIDCPSSADTPNSALETASGEFVAWLDSGDSLSHWALSEVVRALQKSPQAKLLYTDEDLVDAQGQLSSPVFKTQWNPDLLLAGDWVGSLAVFRRSRVQQVGLRRGCDQFDRFDLLLRYVDSLDPELICHVAGPYYHRWHTDNEVSRRFPDQMANVGTPELKRIVERHLSECKSEIRLRSSVLGGRWWPRPVFPLPSPAPLVSVIIPTRDMPELLGQCIHGVLSKTDYSDLEVLIIDNDSSAIGTRLLFSHLSADKRVKILPFPGDFNWSAANNMGAQAAQGSVLVFLNNDIEITDSGWLRELISHAVRPSVGVVGAKLNYKDGRLQHGGMVCDGIDNCLHIYRFADIEDPGHLGQLALTRDVFAVTGACMAVRKVVFDELGGFESRDLKVTWSDVDLCLKARARKLRVVWTPFSKLRHLECATRGHDTSPERIRRFLKEQDYMRATWGRVLREDPFVNPYLAATESGLTLSPSALEARMHVRPAIG
jgi:GT2 family glycosyltransferase